ncbi:MAG: ABC transporter substrate-binding protein [Chloroflexota bacterium]
MRQSLSFLVVFVVSAGVLAGCGSPTHASTVLRIPLNGRIQIPDPFRVHSSRGIFLSSLVYSGLLKYGPDMHVIPELAVSIPTVTDGGRTYTFTIRQHIRFADGTHCFAATIAASLARALSRAQHSAYARRYLGEIEGARHVENGSTDRLSGVKAVGRWGLRIKLTRPDASFLEKLAFPEADVDSPGHGGTGPFEVVQGGSRTGLVLRARRYFYGGIEHLSEIELVPTVGASAVSLYRRGKVDVAPVPVGQFSLSHRSDFHMSAAPVAFYLFPRQPMPGLDYRLNYGSLVDANVALTPLRGIVPPVVPDYVSNARAASKSTGYPGGVTVHLAHSDAAGRFLAARVEAQLGAGDHQVVLREVTRLRPDPEVWLRLSRSNSQGRVARMLRRADRLSLEPVDRMDLYADAERSVLQTGTIVPLASLNLAYLIKPAVQGLNVTPFGLMPDDNNWTNVSLS